MPKCNFPYKYVSDLNKELVCALEHQPLSGSNPSKDNQIKDSFGRLVGTSSPVFFCKRRGMDLRFLITLEIQIDAVVPSYPVQYEPRQNRCHGAAE